MHLKEPPPSPFPRLCTLHTFLSPSLFDHQLTITPRLSTLWQQALLSALITQRVGEEVRLERLSMLYVHQSNLHYISLLRCLQTLQLDGYWGEREAKEDRSVEFCRALIASPLPLRHLRLRLHQLKGRRRNRWPTGLLTTLPAFISAHARQLLGLELHHQHLWVTSRCRLRSRAAMTAALLFVPLAAQTARGRFGLSTCAPTSPSAKPALPHLQSLHVDVIRRLDEDTLAVLLDACPQLQELTIDSTPAPLRRARMGGPALPRAGDADPDGKKGRCARQVPGRAEGARALPLRADSGPLGSSPVRPCPTPAHDAGSSFASPAPQHPRPLLRPPGRLPRPLRSLPALPPPASPRLAEEAPSAAVEAGAADAAEGAIPG